MTDTLYRLQVLTPGGRWLALDVPPQDTEEKAWEQLAAWERYCPRDRFRWTRRHGHD
jgi:hypothetical protein